MAADFLQSNKLTLTKIQNGQDGQPGSAGANGYNAATIYLYQRVASEPSAPSGTLTYDFTTGALSPSSALGNWLTSLPDSNSNHYPCYVAVAAAISNIGIDEILSTDWTITKLVEDGTNGLPGVSITGVVEEYAINNNSTTAPITGWSTSQITPTSSYRYLWNREVISYSSGDPTTTTPHIAGMYSEDGADGKGISSIINTYAINNDGTTAPATGWEETPMAPTSSNKYLWNKEVVNYTTGNPTTTTRVIGTFSEDGYNQATIYLYQRTTATSVSAPTGYSYTFSTNTISPTLTTWSRAIPSGIDPCWVTSAVVVSRTDSNNQLNFVTPTLMVKNGANGANGASYATVYLYKRGSSAPAKPNGNVIYTFSTGAVTGSLNSWTRQIPTGTDPCWMIVAQAVASAGSDTDTISSTEWTTQTKIVENGVDGAPGADGVTITGTAVDYVVSDNGNTPPGPSANWSSSIPSSIPDQSYLWTRTTVSYSDSTPDTVSYSVSYKAKNGTNGTSVTITSKSIQYKVLDIGTGDPGSTGWSNNIPSANPGQYLWTRTIVSYSDGNSTTAYSVSKMGTNGTNGANGYNTATVFLYKRGVPTSPATNFSGPTGTLTYAFTTGQLTASDSSYFNGWSQSIPEVNNDKDPCWVTTAAAISQGSSIDISTNQWSQSVKLVEDGQDGQNGQDGDPGNNYIILYYYKRTTDATVPAPSGNYTYNFNTNTISSEPQGWSTSFPIGDDPCWVTAISFYGTGTTVSGTFTTPVKLVENGEDAGQYQIQSSQQRFLRYLSKNANEEQLLYEISPSTLKFSVKNLKTNTLEVFTENEMDIKLINSFLSEGQTYKSEYSIKTVLGNPNNAYWEYDNNNNITACFLKIDALYNYSQQEVANNVSDDVKGLHDALQAFFNQLQGNICISIGNNTYKAEKYFAIQNGLTDEMIEFQINARNIQAAIDNKKLIFDDNGLTIDNGGFTIRQSNDQGSYDRIFYIDPEQKQIWMQGSGTFTGSITANNGQIGGFSIGAHSIESDNLKLQSQYKDENDQTIESRLEVKNIDIGTGANIQNYLQIGNLKLLNPELNDNYVIKLEDNGVTKFSLTNDGNGYFNGTINATDGSFSGEIVASVINASTINTANFVSEETRTMGGSFIYKPAFEVVKIEEGGSGSTVKTKKIKITLTSNAKAYAISNESGKDRIISLSGNGIRYGKLVDDSNWTEDTIYGEFTTNDHDIILDQTENYNTITFYGYGNDTDLLIGINSDNARIGNIMPPRALVMESFSNLNIPETNGSGTITYNTKLLLGDLSSINSIVGDNAGYGLYSDNVYLKGSLTTTGGDNNYAGVNTRGPIDFNYGLWDTGTSDTSKYSDHKIIFWGGANNTTDSNIQSSKFIVTDKGSIFATSGEFKGSVISDSVISKSVIQAAIIEGTGTSPSLKIYDTGSNGGIGFYKKVSNIDGINNNEDNDELTLSIDTTGLTYLVDKKFIEFNTNEVIATLGRANFGELQINDQGINSSDENIKIKLNNNDRITINANGVTNTGNYITNEGTTIFTSNNKTLKYTVKDGYYVLYVEEVNTQG